MTQQATAMRALGLSPRLSGELLAIVSHDLRTPLSTIALGTTLLEDASQGQEDRTHVIEIIKRAADRMERLIKDLQEMGRLDAGRTLRVDARSVELATLLREACEALRIQAGTKQLDVSCDLPAPPIAVCADPDRICQVLGNLIGNAIKFTPRRVPGRAGGARLGHRPGTGHSRGGPPACLRAVLAGGKHGAAGRRDRAQDRQGPRGSARRPDLGREQGRRRNDVLVHAPRGRLTGAGGIRSPIASPTPPGCGTPRPASRASPRRGRRAGRDR